MRGPGWLRLWWARRGVVARVPRHSRQMFDAPTGFVRLPGSPGPVAPPIVVGRAAVPSAVERASWVVEEPAEPDLAVKPRRGAAWPGLPWLSLNDGGHFRGES